MLNLDYAFEAQNNSLKCEFVRDKVSNWAKENKDLQEFEILIGEINNESNFLHPYGIALYSLSSSSDNNFK